MTKTLETRKLQTNDALLLTTGQLLELSEAFKSVSFQTTNEEASKQLFRMGCKMWAYADKRRRANVEQAQAFELSIRRVRSLKANGEVR